VVDAVISQPAIEELHISSLVVYSTPARAPRVAAVVAAIPGAEVHAVSPQGKLVVTLDARSADDMLAKVARIQRADGVLSAALVYQCADSLQSMNEEIPDALSADDRETGLH
jgi:nitrate reductase NapD